MHTDPCPSPRKAHVPGVPRRPQPARAAAGRPGVLAARARPAARPRPEPRRRLHQSVLGDGAAQVVLGGAVVGRAGSGSHRRGSRGSRGRDRGRGRSGRGRRRRCRGRCRRAARGAGADQAHFRLAEPRRPRAAGPGCRAAPAGGRSRRPRPGSPRLAGRSSVRCARGSGEWRRSSSRSNRLAASAHACIPHAVVVDRARASRPGARPGAALGRPADRDPRAAARPLRGPGSAAAGRSPAWRSRRAPAAAAAIASSARSAAARRIGSSGGTPRRWRRVEEAGGVVGVERAEPRRAARRRTDRRAAAQDRAEDRIGARPSPVGRRFPRVGRRARPVRSRSSRAVRRRRRGSSSPSPSPSASARIAAASSARAEGTVTKGIGSGARPICRVAARRAPRRRSAPPRPRRRGSPRPGRRGRGLPPVGGLLGQHDDRLAGAEPARHAGEASRVAERLDLQQRHPGRRIVLPVLEQVVGADVGALAERDEGGEADVAAGRGGEQATRRGGSLGDDADAARGRQRLGPGQVRARGRAGCRGSRPRRVRPVRMPVARQAASSSSARAKESSPGTTIARAPAAPRSPGRARRSGRPRRRRGP